MRDVIKSSKKIRRKKTLNSVVFLICVFVLLFLIAGHISQADRFLIKEVQIAGNKTVSKTEIFDQIRQSLSGRYFNIFPRSNFIIYPQKEIEELILKKFLKIESVFVNDRDIKKLEIVLKEREPKFVWCPRSDNDCYYLDGNGMVFETAPNLSEGIFFKIKGGLSKGENPEKFLGKNILEKEKLLNLISFKDEIGAIVKKEIDPKWGAVFLEIVEGEDYSVHFSDGNIFWKIMFSAKDPSRQASLPSSSGEEGVLKIKQEDVGSNTIEAGLINTARNLEALVLSPAFKINFEKKESVVDYIDLRFGKKIFYKFKDTTSNLSEPDKVIQ